MILPLRPAPSKRRWVAVGVLAALAGVVVVAARRARNVPPARSRLLESERAHVRADRRFDPDDVADLPDPVRRYFEAAIEPGCPVVRTARIEQRGEFRLGDASSPWKRLSAVQHVTTDPPGFVWDATVRLAPLVPVRVVDAYVDGRGSLRARIGSLLTVAEPEPSPELDAGELQRYLAEAVWYPTALLPADGVSWEALDDRSARATLTHRETTVSLTFHFGDDDLVERVVAEDRPRAVDDGFEPTRWIGQFREYESRNGLCVPTEAEVAWTLPDGELPYWRAQITAVEHSPLADAPQ
ncbi:hypothetical protein SAMN06269185_0216 [Natronoarchaeum philippinense]|uniref:Outer membrane lipoprotein-sorting protein n=1 Tax=Natronoarchaeum philippinense TaxID=558529 RepID=A0A285N2N8_NATPI|nr:DUF6544 family protein [Natronoarchaeum philippinense]SNZ03203.1 hypothetical protein SAMN06269185_0216 [Natronoarchaeum philippinense]